MSGSSGSVRAGRFVQYPVLLLYNCTALHYTTLHIYAPTYLPTHPTYIYTYSALLCSLHVGPEATLDVGLEGEAIEKHSRAPVAGSV